MKPLSLLVIGIFLIIMNSCSVSYQLASSWFAPGFQLKNYKKVLIIGLMGDKDTPLRQDIELDMAEALEIHGIKAYSAFEKFGDRSFMPNGDTTALLAFRDVFDSTYDAIMCVVLVDKDKQTRYVPSTYTTSLGYYYPPYSYGSYFNNYGGFNNYFYQSYNTIYQPGYYVTTTKYTIETNIFDSSKDSLVYFAETKTKNPADLENLSIVITESIMRDMTAKNILPPPVDGAIKQK